MNAEYKCTTKIIFDLDFLIIFVFNMIRRIICVLLVLLCKISFAQTEAELDSIKKTHTVQFSGFIDAYYSFDFNTPPNHEVSAPFIYNYKRNNEFNINLALLSATYSGDKIRSKIGLMAGTYAQYNYASEQGLLKNIYEANAGIKLRKNDATLILM